MALRLGLGGVVLGLVTVALITAFVAPREAPAAAVDVLAPVELEVSVAIEIEPALALPVTPRLDLLAEARTRSQAPAPLAGPVATPSHVVRATAYNSMESQTNAQPHVTATGTRTRWGIIAVSRDLLGFDLPYGSLVRLHDLGNYHNGRGFGAYQTLLDGTALFVVEDTMHPRKTNQIDLWFADYASAVNWGVRRVEVEVVRYGYDGPQLDHLRSDSVFDVDPRWLAVR